jgi:iron complex transport system substrate-binding protein
MAIIAIVFLLAAAATATAADLAVEAGAIIDAAGRRIPTDRPFQRIISLYGAHTENLFALGAGSQVIGVSCNDDWPIEAKEKPVFSYHDDLEKFLATRPDLVLIRPMVDRGYARLMNGLERHGVAVVSLQPTTLEQMYLYWEILGRLTGRQAAAAQMTVRFKQTTARIASLTAAIPDKKRVYFEAIHDRMRTFAPSAMPIFVLETAGGVNVAPDAVPRRGTNIADYGKERILSHADEIDVYIAQYGPMNRPTCETIASEPGYDLIKAVRNKHIHLIDERLVSRPTLRMLDGICRMAGILYPRMFSGGDVDSACISSTGMAAGERIQKEIAP